MCVKNFKNYIILNTQPLVLTKITKPNIESNNAVSSSTLKRRANEVKEIRQLVAGANGADVQHTQELKQMSGHELQKLLKNAGVHHEIDARQSLAFKATEQLSWTKLRSLRRFVFIVNFPTI
jgi:hypothetical protein